MAAIAGLAGVMLALARPIARRLGVIASLLNSIAAFARIILALARTTATRLAAIASQLAIIAASPAAITAPPGVIARCQTL